MKLALAGIGKIALDQHVPALQASPDWELAATISRKGGVAGLPAYHSLAEMRAAHPDIGVVSLCLPPVPRYAMAQAALAAGMHVMLEKPPGASLAEVHALEALARSEGVTLYASWHSRKAKAVAAAKAVLAEREVFSGRIIWREDVQKWHPGQDWIFEAGGMGVFDPGINALSILTEILPNPLRVRAARLEVPENRQAPIAAQIELSQNISVDFDFRQTGVQTWDILLETDQGEVALRMGGNLLELGGTPASGDLSIMGEYPRLYADLARLVREARTEVDLAPMVLVADTFTLAERVSVAPFHFLPAS